jgi:hypothetical protein
VQIRPHKRIENTLANTWELPSGRKHDVIIPTDELKRSWNKERQRLRKKKSEIGDAGALMLIL